MADMKLEPRAKTPSRDTADSSNMKLWRGDRTGVGFITNEMEDYANQGRIMVANMGTVTTPITFLATAANRPDAWIRVPSGTTIKPLHLDVAFEAMAGTDTEVDVRICNNDIGNGTSTAADIGPLSTRTDAPIGIGSCTARQLATADTTAETTPRSVYRAETSLAEGSSVSSPGVHINRADMGYPVLVGPATWEVFIAATSTQAIGFVVMTWAEIPSTDVV